MSPTRQSRRSSRRRPKNALVWAVLAMVLLALGSSQAAFAQDSTANDDPGPILISIDTVDDAVAIVRSAQQPSDVEVTVGIEPATVSGIVSMADSERVVQTVLVIDNGADSSRYLDSFIAAAREYVASAPDNETISIWSTGGSARLRAGMDSDRARLDAVLANIRVALGNNYMWDTVRSAAFDLTETAVGSTNIVVFAGSPDVFAGSPDIESLTTSTEARGAVLAAKASAFVVAIDDPAMPLQSLTRLAAVTPAGDFVAGDADLAAAYGASVSAAVAGTWLIEFDAVSLLDENQIDITIDGTLLAASYVSGSVASGSALIPFRPSEPGGLSALRGDSGRTIGIVLGALAAALGAYALVTLFQKGPSQLSSTLMPYTGMSMGEADQPEDESSGFSRSVLVKRAVELTEGIAERQGVMAKSEALLERADMPLRVGEALSGYAAIVLGSMVLGLVMGKTLMSMAIFGALGLIVPPMVVKVKGARRRKKFMAQLPDTLQLLSSTLKAGYSFMQGIEAVSQEIDGPMATELKRIVTEAQLGRPVEEAMDSSAIRMESDDFAWAVMAVRIQREVGGNLAELLLTVSETMKERESLRRDVSALTAEGKVSAIVLGALPLILGFVMWAMNPEYIEILFIDPVGKILLVVSVIAALAGFAWMKKIITIDI